MHQDCIYTHTNRIMSKVWSHWTVFLVEVTVPIAVVGLVLGAVTVAAVAVPMAMREVVEFRQLRDVEIDDCK